MAQFYSLIQGKSGSMVFIFLKSRRSTPIEHKTPMMTQRYAHHHPESLRGAVDNSYEKKRKGKSQLSHKGQKKASFFKEAKFRNIWFYWCLGPELNRHGGGPPRDFKSLASTNSATQAFFSFSVIRDACHVSIIIISFRGFCQPLPCFTKNLVLEVKNNKESHITATQHGHGHVIFFREGENDAIRYHEERARKSTPPISL